MMKQCFPYRLLYWIPPRIWRIQCHACSSEYIANATFWGTVTGAGLYSRFGNLLLTMPTSQLTWRDESYVLERDWLLSSAPGIVDAADSRIPDRRISFCPLCGGHRGAKEVREEETKKEPCLVLIHPQQRISDDAFGKLSLRTFGSVLFSEEDCLRLGEKNLFSLKRPFCDLDPAKKKRDAFPYDLRFTYETGALQTRCGGCESEFYVLPSTKRRPHRYLYSRLGNLIWSIPEDLLDDPAIRCELMLVLSRGSSLFRFVVSPESDAFECPYCGNGSAGIDRSVHPKKAVIPCLARSKPNK